MPTTPKASICIPSYNHARFLPAALDSALAQTYPNVEIVVVDDGSTDASLEIAEAYAARHPSRVKVYTHPGGRNLGISATVNLGFEKSEGVYYSGLPSDDVLYPDKIERQVAFLEQHPEVGWVYSYGDFIDKTGRVLPELGRFGIDISRDERPIELQIQRNVIPGMTVLARRACVETIGRHDPSLVYSDWHFWTRLFSLYKVGFVDRALVGYRAHDYNTSLGIDLTENAQRGLAVMRALRQGADETGGELAKPSSKALLDLQIAYHSYCLGDAPAAERSLSSVFDTYPALRDDADRLFRWLGGCNLYHFEYGINPQDFARWVVLRLPRLVGRASARRLTARWYAESALRSYYNGGAKRGEAGRMALNSWMNEPGRLRDRALLGVFIKSLAGPRVVAYLRRLRHGAADKESQLL
jgi:hypothetical protein